MNRFRKIRLLGAGRSEEGDWEPSAFKAERAEGPGRPYRSFSARFDLFLIQEARARGCDFEDLADGMEGFAMRLNLDTGTATPVSPGKGGGWSAIRASSPDALAAMLERALNFLFPLDNADAGYADLTARFYIRAPTIELAAMESGTIARDSRIDVDVVEPLRLARGTDGDENAVWSIVERFITSRADANLLDGVEQRLHEVSVIEPEIERNA